MVCDFSFRHLKESLDRAQKLGYHFRRFSEIKRGQRMSKSILLRHDVDKSVSKAAQLARIEASLGIGATFFIRLHSNYYNPFGHLAYQYLREIQSAGHDIQLHTEFFDFAKISGEQATAVLKREVAAFEAILGTRVKLVAPHRTSGSSSTAVTHNALARARKPLRLRSAYDEEFTHGWKYISDSSGTWREGCLCQWIGKENRLQVLIHPEWWFENHIELEEPLV
jgi:hypothetical protein